MNKKSTQKSFNQGRTDKKKKVHKPPSKGTSKTKSSLIGAGLGLLTAAPTGGTSVVAGGVLGYLLGDSKKELKQKKQNRNAYYAGKNSPPKKGKSTRPKK